jgi:hypothetical protein
MTTAGRGDFFDLQVNGRMKSSVNQPKHETRSCRKCGISFRCYRSAKQVYCSEQCYSEIRSARCKLLAKDPARVKRGVVTREAMPQCAKGELHSACKVWRVKSPRGVLYEFRNVRVFIDSHRHLFDKDDLSPRYSNGRNRATNGILLCNPNLSHGLAHWKGWTVLSVM